MTFTRNSRYTFEVAPAFTLIELKMIQHILQLFGIPEGDGIFSPGGSMSMFYGIVAARHKAFPEVKAKGMRGLPELVLFTSEDVSNLYWYLTQLNRNRQSAAHNDDNVNIEIARKITSS